MIIAGQVVCIAASTFFLFYILGCAKMGDEWFEIWLGEKLIGTGRWILSKSIRR